MRRVEGDMRGVTNQRTARRLAGWIADLARRRLPLALVPLLIPLLVMLLVLAGCGDGGGVHLDQSDDGKTITVQVGDEVVVTLDENPTTGYTWDVEKIDDSILALKSSDYTRTGPPVPGAGGVRTFTFTAKQAGTSPLELKDWRAEEGDKSIVGHFSITIDVKAS